MELIKEGDSKMKFKDYEFYDRNAQPKVTVCLVLDDDGIWARGISVCSRMDEYDEEEGRKLARNMALRALKDRKIDRFMRREAVSMLIECEVPFTEKGELMPNLSWFERKLLYGIKQTHIYLDELRRNETEINKFFEDEKAA